MAKVSAPTVDALAAFEAEGEDRENDLEDEPNGDEEPSVPYGSMAWQTGAVFDGEGDGIGD